PLAHVVSALIGGEVGASLPIPAFMSFGVYETGSALVLQLLGVVETANAFVTMLCVHIWSQLFDYVLGGLFLLIFVLRYSNREQAASQPERKGLKALVPLLIAGLVLATAFSFFGYQAWRASKLGALIAPVTGQAVLGAEMTLGVDARPDGFVVFSSNRDGNHDIFKLELKQNTLTKLTEHPHTETYPRISPDGKKMVFARSHVVWVSQRNVTAWDVILMDLETGKETVLGRNGTSPHWINNQEISFVAAASKMIGVNVNTLAQRTLFEPGVNNAMRKGALFYNPRFNPNNGVTTLTGRQADVGLNTGFWGTALVSSERMQGVLNGCELLWSSQYDNLFQVTGDGRNGGLRIVTVDPSDQQISTLIDLDGEFSHEYWPKDSWDGSYVVFGASRGSHDHEHDTKDYEIFLWKSGSDPAKAERLTFHTGNDNWPDVYLYDQ
ncbi:MAG: hypothetical protein AAF197_09375, partial [Pseudomonadota bacterium]